MIHASDATHHPRVCVFAQDMLMFFVFVECTRDQCVKALVIIASVCLRWTCFMCEDALTPYCVGALLCVCCVFVLWSAILVIKLCSSSSLMSRLSWWLIWCVYSVVAFDHVCVDLSLQVMMPASHATDAPRFCAFAPDVLCFILMP